MDIGVPELIIVLIIVLLIFGPGRIVKIASELGASIRQFRQGLGTFTNPEKSSEENPPDTKTQ